MVSQGLEMRLRRKMRESAHWLLDMVLFGIIAEMNSGSFPVDLEEKTGIRGEDFEAKDAWRYFWKLTDTQKKYAEMDGVLDQARPEAYWRLKSSIIGVLDAWVEAVSLTEPAGVEG